MSVELILNEMNSQSPRQSDREKDRQTIEISSRLQQKNNKSNCNRSYLLPSTLRNLIFSGGALLIFRGFLCADYPLIHISHLNLRRVRVQCVSRHALGGLIIKVINERSISFLHHDDHWCKLIQCYVSHNL